MVNCECVGIIDRKFLCFAPGACFNFFDNDFFENFFDNQSLTDSVHKPRRVMSSMLVVVLFNGSFKDDFLIDTFDCMVDNKHG